MLARQGRLRHRRRGSAAVWTLVAMTTMLTALALALNAGWLSAARQELTTAADAAALAAANELLNDAWLRQGKPGVAALLQDARAAAAAFAAKNRVLGRSLGLDTAGPNGRDVLLGSYDPATPGTLTKANLSDPAGLSLDDVDAVVVAATRSARRGNAVPVLLGALVLQPSVDMRVSSLAYLDRDVVGFRARPGNPIPLVPIGVRSDPSGSDPASWEFQVRLRNGPDDFFVHPDTGLFAQGADQIPEVVLELQLQPSGDPSQSTATLLTIGSGQASAQVAGGVTEQDLQSHNGRLVLGPTDTLTLPGTGLGPDLGSVEYQGLIAALKRLRDTGSRRVWPLVSAASGGQVTVNAFVAARVVQVEEAAGGPLRLRLQPTVMAVPQAITDFSRRTTAYLLPNDYLARPRLAR
ncbi:MAG: pilus assembly protein TadG-related protein [Gemmataceae bacterium]